MAVAVIMPRQGNTVESCIITKWNKKKGDTVAVGDILFSYETDKAAFDEEAKEAGTMLEAVSYTHLAGQNPGGAVARSAAAAAARFSARRHGRHADLAKRRSRRCSGGKRPGNRLRPRRYHRAPVS